MDRGINIDDREIYDKSKSSILDKILALMLGIIVSIMFLQVVFRYIFNNSISWSEETVRYLFVWITFFGAALCFRDRLNIGVDFFIEILPKRLRKIAMQLNLVIMILFTIFMIASGLAWVVNGGTFYGSSIVIPMNWILYGALPVSSIWSLYFLTDRFHFTGNNSGIL